MTIWTWKTTMAIMVTRRKPLHRLPSPRKARSALQRGLTRLSSLERKEGPGPRPQIAPNMILTTWQTRCYNVRIGRFLTRSISLMRKKWRYYSPSSMVRLSSPRLSLPTQSIAYEMTRHLLSYPLSASCWPLRLTAPKVKTWFWPASHKRK